MATRTRRTPAITPPPVTTPIVIAPDLQRMMDYLKSFYSPGRLQIRYQEHLAGLPKDMPDQERKLRIEACRMLGYKDLEKIKTAADDAN